MNGQASIRRQKLLLRILPGLVVLVGYFSFIGPQIRASPAHDLMHRRIRALYQGPMSLTHCPASVGDEVLVHSI